MYGFESIMCICTYQRIRLSDYQIIRGEIHEPEAKEMEILPSVDGRGFF